MKENKDYTFFGILVVIGIFVLTYLYKEVTNIPVYFPVSKSFFINENESLRSVSVRLEKERYITSALLFRAGVSFFGKDTDVHLGGYVFESPQSLLSVIAKFTEGKPDLPLLSITIPEGSTSFEIATLVARALPRLSVDIFGEMISKYDADGRLFPSTYFLLPSYKEEDIVKLMLSTFTKKTDGIINPSLIKAPLTTEEDVLTLASILEGEANTKEGMEIVAGILIARLNKGMPLQVDVAKETYKQKGLPHMPINNPGLMAITAALNPVTTPYLYYITGKDGEMYYAKTFEEHKRNIQKYLR